MSASAQVKCTWRSLLVSPGPPHYKTAALLGSHEPPPARRWPGSTQPSLPPWAGHLRGEDRRESKEERERAGKWERDVKNRFGKEGMKDEEQERNTSSDVSDKGTVSCWGTWLHWNPDESLCQWKSQPCPSKVKMDHQWIINLEI